MDDEGELEVEERHSDLEHHSLEFHSEPMEHCVAEEWASYEVEDLVIHL